MGPLRTAYDPSLKSSMSYGFEPALKLVFVSMSCSFLWRKFMSVWSLARPDPKLSPSSRRWVC